MFQRSRHDVRPRARAHQSLSLIAGLAACLATLQAQGPLRVRKDIPGRFRAEWLDVNAKRPICAKAVEGWRCPFTTPFPAPAVLYLNKE